jgi:hypothetical protein
MYAPLHTSRLPVFPTSLPPVVKIVTNKAVKAIQLNDITKFNGQEQLTATCRSSFTASNKRHRLATMVRQHDARLVAPTDAAVFTNTDNEPRMATCTQTRPAYSSQSLLTYGTGFRFLVTQILCLFTQCQFTTREQKATHLMSQVTLTTISDEQYHYEAHCYAVLFHLLSGLTFTRFLNVHYRVHNSPTSPLS